MSMWDKFQRLSMSLEDKAVRTSPKHATQERLGRCKACPKRTNVIEVDFFLTIIINK